MTKRGRIVLYSATVLFTLFAIVMVALVSTLQTSFGHEKIRQLIMSSLKGRVNGSIYIGRIESGLLTGITVDSFAIRGPDDSLFVSTGRVTLRYDIRDLLDRRMLVRASKVERPYVHLKQYGDGQWNFRRIFKSNSPKQEPQQPQQGLADYIILESTRLRDGNLVLTLPWRPPSWAKGAVRDSIIRYELSRDDIEIRRAGIGFTRTWRWEDADGELARARLTDPDSAERVFEIRTLSVTELDPPFRFNDIRGTVRQLGDSVWIDLKHFDLPGSTGHGAGKIVWGSNLPIRYDIDLIGDSVSLKDVAWIHPSIPKTGGGSTNLRIRNNPGNVRRLDYILTDMDLRSNRSHLTGQMTFELGADTLVVKDVQLGMSPVNFDLLRALNQGPFPYDWQGDITGTLRASGGNLARFKIEEANFSFADANVPGAIARGKANGEVNIFEPALAEFHGLNVIAETVDLRTFQYLNKDFAQLQGTVSGHAILDSSWLDVRFREAELWHHYKDSPRSRVTGSGRVTWGEKYLTYDMELHGDSIAMTTLRESYPTIPLKGMFAGPIRVQGQSPDLQVVTTLSGPGGIFTYEGNTDMALPVYGARGRGTFENLDLRTAMAGKPLPRSNLKGRFVVNLTGDSVATLDGSAFVEIDPSTLGAARLKASHANLRFQHGLAYVDTAFFATERASLSASGTFGMIYGAQGKLAYSLSLASLGELDRILERPVKDPQIAGDIVVQGSAKGALDSLDIDGRVRAKQVNYKTFRVGAARGDFSVNNLLYAPAGFVNLTADTIGTQTVTFDSATASVEIAGLQRAIYRMRAVGRKGIRADAAGDIVVNDSTTTVNVSSAGIAIDSINTYLLSAPTSIVMSSTMISTDSVMLARKAGGTIAVRYLRISDDSLRGTLRTSALDMAVLELFGSKVAELGGTLTAAVDLRGTTSQPRFTGAVTVESGTVLFPQVGARLVRMKAYITLDGDTIRVRELTAETNASKEHKGTLALDGTVVFDRLDNPIFALRAVAKNFRAVDKRGLASLDISTSDPLTLTGPYSAAVVTGGIHVDRGAVYLPELIRKRLVDLNDPELYDVIDTTVAKNRTLVPEVPSEFVRNLRLDNVGITIGDEVWLRSAEANIKLDGSLTVQGGTQSDGGQQLALQGELRTTRGTYRLNIVPLVQPTFEVESGTIRFYGTTDLEPTLNITAINTVRKPQQSVTNQDIRIRATIGGTLSSPTLKLSSADNLPLTQSDLLSYLITGEPAFALDYTTQTYVNQLAAVVIRSAGNVLTSAIPRSLFDVIELQTPGARDNSDSQLRVDNPTLYNLLNTRAIFGKQLNNNLFLNLSTGFCKENFGNNLGFRLEYRFNRTYRLLFGLEPGSSELTCAQSNVGGTARSLQQTPPQFGLDFFRTWRF